MKVEAGCLADVTQTATAARREVSAIPLCPAAPGWRCRRPIHGGLMEGAHIGVLGQPARDPLLEDVFADTVHHGGDMDVPFWQRVSRAASSCFA